MMKRSLFSSAFFFFSLDAGSFKEEIFRVYSGTLCVQNFFGMGIYPFLIRLFSARGAVVVG